MIFNMIVVTITAIFMVIKCFLNYDFGFLYLRSSDSANSQLPGCFRPWTFSLNIGLNVLLLVSFMSCLHSLLGYSTGEFQALQLIALAAFGFTFLLNYLLFVNIFDETISIYVDPRLNPQLYNNRSNPVSLYFYIWFYWKSQYGPLLQHIVIWLLYSWAGLCKRRQILWWLITWYLTRHFAFCRVFQTCRWPAYVPQTIRYHSIQIPLHSSNHVNLLSAIALRVKAGRLKRPVIQGESRLFHVSQTRWWITFPIRVRQVCRS